MLLPEHERLCQQHDWHARQRDDHQELLYEGLAGVHVARVAVGLGLVLPEQDHVDEGDEDGRGAALRVVELLGGEVLGLVRVGVVRRPLVEHQN